MSKIHIPVWLKQRPIFQNDISEMRQMFSETDNQQFGNITSQILKECYRRLPARSFYKLVRVLGFYGVQFSGKLAPYSIHLEPFPLLINIPQHYWEEPCPSFDSSLSSYFLSLGIHQLKQLHGIPRVSLNHATKFWGNLHHRQKISPEIASRWFHASFTKAHKDFFKRNTQTDVYEARENSEKIILENKANKQVLLQPIDILNLSERSGNCLKSVDIHTIGELIQKNEKELLKIWSFGRKSLREVNQKLSGSRLHLGMNNAPTDIIKPIIGVDLVSEETLSKLNTLLSDIKLTVRSKNALELRGMKYIWELIILKESDLKQTKNIGRKSIDELKKIVADIGFQLGIQFTPDQIETIQKYQIDTPEFSGEWFVHIVQDPLLLHLDFLNKNQKLIVHERVWKREKKYKLIDIAQKLNISRERARQIESQALKEIKQQFQKELRNATADMRKQVEALGGIANLEDLKFQIDFSVQEQIIMDSLLSLQDETVYIDWECRLICNKGNSWIVSLCSDIKKRLQKNISQSVFFTLQEIENAVEQISSQYKIFRNSHIQNLVRRFLHEEEISEVGKYLHFGRTTKRDKLAFAFKELFPRGLEIFKQRELLLKRLIEFDPQTYRNMRMHRIEILFTAHSDILLWGKRFMIHKDHLSFDIDIAKHVAVWIKQRFEQGYSQFRVHLPYNQFKTQLQRNGIPNPYALYTVLRNIQDERIGQKRFPTIVDLDAGV